MVFSCSIMICQSKHCSMCNAIEEVSAKRDIDTFLRDALMGKFFYLTITTFLISAVLSVWQQGYAFGGYQPYELIYDETAPERNVTTPLFTQAIRQTVYDELDSLPLFLMIYRGTTLEDYLEEQGVSQEEFLQHENLDAYVRSHLIFDYLDNKPLLAHPGATATYTNALGEEVTFTMLDHAIYAQVTGGGTVNLQECHISFTLSGNYRESYDPSYLCYMEKPMDLR